MSLDDLWPASGDARHDRNEDAAKGEDGILAGDSFMGRYASDGKEVDDGSGAAQSLYVGGDKGSEGR